MYIELICIYIITTKPTHKMATSEAQKQANNRYRQKHREEAKLCTKKFIENNPNYFAGYYVANHEVEKTRSRKYQTKINLFKQEFRRLSKIDL